MSGDDLLVWAGVPAVLVVSGSSMAPGLRPGWRVRVVPIDGAPTVGDVVVLRCGAGRTAAAADARRGDDTCARSLANLSAGSVAPAFVVHRVVWSADVGGRRVVFHRGDAGGRVGVTTRDAVIGRVASVLAVSAAASSATENSAPSVPALDALDAAQRRAFLRAQRRCRVYVALHRAAAWAGLARAREARPVRCVTAWVRRLLLRA